MTKKQIIAYSIIALLLCVFGLAAWLASEGRFLEAVSVVGVATTLAWFAGRMISDDSG